MGLLSKLFIWKIDVLVYTKDVKRLAPLYRFTLYYHLIVIISFSVHRDIWWAELTDKMISKQMVCCVEKEHLK